MIYPHHKENNIHNKKPGTRYETTVIFHGFTLSLFPHQHIEYTFFSPFIFRSFYVPPYIIGSIRGVLDKHRSDVLFFIEMEIDMVLFGWVDIIPIPT